MNDWLSFAPTWIIVPLSWQHQQCFKRHEELQMRLEVTQCFQSAAKYQRIMIMCAGVSVVPKKIQLKTQLSNI